MWTIKWSNEDCHWRLYGPNGAFVRAFPDKDQVVEFLDWVELYSGHPIDWIE